jgi:hypothetical protein
MLIFYRRKTACREHNFKMLVLPEKIINVEISVGYGLLWALVRE